MTSNMSVLGLYTYDNTLFANMNYPEGFETEDKTNLVNNLLCELAEMEVLYTSPAFMKTIIGVWSYKEKPTWDRIYAAAQLEYNPIENYDRQESSTDTTAATRKHSGSDSVTNTGNDVTAYSGSDTVTNAGTDTTTNSGKDTMQDSGTEAVANTGTDTTTNSGKDTTQDSGTEAVANTGTDSTTHGGTDTTTNKVAGFDSGNLENHDSSAVAHGHTESLLHGHTATTTFGKKEELTHGHVEALQHGHTATTTFGKKEELTHGHVEALQHGHTVTNAMGHSETLTHGHVATTQHGEQIKDDSSVTRSSRIHGNIGVTTSQQMLEQELEVAPKLNIMNVIIESFKNRFCLLVY